MSPGTLLYRVVSIAFVHRGSIILQVFQPQRSREQSLHVYNGDRVSAEEAWVDLTRSSGASNGFAGVVGVTVAECDSLSLRVAESTYDPLRAQIHFPHSNHSETLLKAHTLKEFAQVRGWLFRPR